MSLGYIHCDGVAFTHPVGTRPWQVPRKWRYRLWLLLPFRTDNRAVVASAASVAVLSAQVPAEVPRAPRAAFDEPCGKTFTILPEWLAPSGQYTLRCPQEACERDRHRRIRCAGRTALQRSHPFAGSLYSARLGIPSPAQPLLRG